MRNLDKNSTEDRTSAPNYTGVLIAYARVEVEIYEAWRINCINLGGLFHEYIFLVYICKTFLIMMNTQNSITADHSNTW